MTLKEEFVASIAGQLKDELPAFLMAMQEPPLRGLRLNGAAPACVQPDLLGPVSWAEDGYYLAGDSRLGQSAAHEAGAFYIQEPSAMAAAAALSPGPADTVLDLCAAPGGKSGQLARMLPEGTLVANEIHPGRAKILSSNLERLGCANTVVTNADPERLRSLWPETFDAILVDAPCSGEGMFRKNPAAADEWLPSSPNGCAVRQKAILSCAADMLQPGGRMAYSTCTFNLLENDWQIEEFLTAHPDFEPVPFALPGLPAAPEGILHIWPHQVRGEGHFIALMRKKGSPSRPAARGTLPAPDQKTLDNAFSSLSEILLDPPRPDGVAGDLLLKLPAFLPPLKGIRMLRAGLALGRFHGRAFVPDHALSRRCQPKTVFPVDNQEALCYLRGETLPLSDEKVRGFGVVMLEGLPLGWGKAADGQIKNHYPKGLRKDLSS